MDVEGTRFRPWHLPRSCGGRACDLTVGRSWPRGLAGSWSRGRPRALGTVPLAWAPPAAGGREAGGAPPLPAPCPASGEARWAPGPGSGPHEQVAGWPWASRPPAQAAPVAGLIRKRSWEKGGSPGGSDLLWKVGVSSGRGEGPSEGPWAGGPPGDLKMEGPRPEPGGRGAESRPGPQPAGKRASLSSRPTWGNRPRPG